jgi:hypothetical protein
MKPQTATTGVAHHDAVDRGTGRISRQGDHRRTGDDPKQGQCLDLVPKQHREIRLGHPAGQEERQGFRWAWWCQSEARHDLGIRPTRAGHPEQVERAIVIRFEIASRDRPARLGTDPGARLEDERVEPRQLPAPEIGAAAQGSEPP